MRNNNVSRKRGAFYIVIKRKVKSDTIEIDERDRREGNGKEYNGPS